MRGRGRAARLRPSGSHSPIPLLQGRPRRATHQGLRAEEQGTSGTGSAGLPGGSNSPFGDVGVRFGGSEHHQGRAPAFRKHHSTSVAWSPLPASAGGGPPGPSGHGRQPRLPRSPDRFANPPRRTSGPRCRRLRPRQHGHRQQLRLAEMSSDHGGFGRRGRATPTKASAIAGACLHWWPRLSAKCRLASVG